MTEYILVDKQDEGEVKITKKEALEWIAKSYRHPKHVLENAKMLFNNRINGKFRVLEIS